MHTKFSKYAYKYNRYSLYIVHDNRKGYTPTPPPTSRWVSLHTPPVPISQLLPVLNSLSLPTFFLLVSDIRQYIKGASRYIILVFI
jgi:hypothetical protein